MIWLFLYISIPRENHHASVVWNWYHWVAIAYLYQPSPNNSRHNILAYILVLYIGLFYQHNFTVWYMFYHTLLYDICSCFYFVFYIVSNDENKDIQSININMASKRNTAISMYRSMMYVYQAHYWLPQIFHLHPAIPLDILGDIKVSFAKLDMW